MTEDFTGVTLQPVSEEEMVNYLEHHKVSPTCPSCSHTGGALHLRTGQKTLQVFTMTTALVVNGRLEADQGVANSSACIECTNCGYQRFFSLGRIVNWLTSRKH